MQTSARGVADLELHEGVVLKAYRDPVGIWTIGAGLTRASGVIVPKPGMTITRGESERLTALALARNYEPRVAKAMPGATQQEFDGGVDFDWNTGAIDRASWVKAWRARFWPGVQNGLMQWVKGRGRFLPGLKRRRQAQYEMMRFGVYQSDEPVKPRIGAGARITLRLSPEEIEATRKALATLGYDPGNQPGEISRAQVVEFQRAHDLLADGILGRATLSTLERAIKARDTAKVAMPVAAVTVPASATAMSTDLTDQIADLPYLGEAMLAGLVIWGLWQAWSYRDIVAAWVQTRLPRLATWLRSF
jgi:lysozyme